MERNDLDRGTARTAAELRMQLAQMTAASQMLERNARDEKNRGYLAALNQSICRMLRIVGRMELTARLTERPEPQPELAPADLGELVSELGGQLAGLLEHIGVRLSVRAPAHVAAQTDSGLIRQMLLELVANAVGAGDQVELALTRHGDKAVFTVTDNGVGMTAEVLDRLFRGDEEQTPDWRRKGNGVAIARRIASLHGGTLMAGSGADRGLSVTAAIPLGQARSDWLDSPALGWDRGGFDEALVALSGLLPAGAFAPERAGDTAM